MKLIAGLAALALIHFLPAAPAWAQANQAHAHIGHIMNSWQATPDNKGLLETADVEAAIAVRHASYATADAGDLIAIQRHVRHVVHAIDPRAQTSGPGRGFGVLPAAAAVMAHIDLALQSPEVTQNIRLHGAHARAGADNVVAWCRRIVELSKGVATAADAGTAYELASRIEVLTDQIVNGVDADGDGSIAWGPNEGGLKQLRIHMNYMKAGEGLN